MVRGPTRSRHRRRNAAFLFSAAVVFISLDVLLFRLVLWQIPNESAWESEPLYSFEHRLRGWEQDSEWKQAARGPRVLIVGSSIAAYGILPKVVSRELSRRLRPAESGPERVRGPRADSRVVLLGRQGLHWVELRVLVRRLLAQKPDIVIVPTNMVDFRLERSLVLSRTADLLSNQAGRSADALQALLRDEYDRPEVRLHAPLNALRCCFFRMGGDERAEALVGALVASFRFRAVWRKPLALLYSNRFGRGHSYLHYAGAAVGSGNVTHRGRTAGEFLLPVSLTLLASGLEIEAPPGLFAVPGAPRLELRLFRAVPGESSHAPAGCPRGTPRAKRTVELRRGWQNVPLLGLAVPGDVLCGRVSPLWWSDLAADLLGVRLARNTAAGPRTGLDEARPIRREDEQYRAYSDDQYRRSFQQRIMQFSRPGAEYLHALHQARLFWRERDFVRALPSAHALSEFRREVSEAGVRLLLVNAPENPISRALYDDSRWYSGYRAFLSEAPAGSPGDFAFLDSGALLPMQMFYDTHHLSYYGAERFSRAVAEAVPIGWLHAGRAER